MSDAVSLVESLSRRGIRLTPNPPKLTVEPASKLTDADREAIRQHKPALLALLTAPKAKEAPQAECGCPLHLVEILADAVATCPRSPIEDDLAYARIARVTVESARTIRELSDGARKEAFKLCRENVARAAERIRDRNYRAAYDLLDGLPERLRTFRSQ